MTARNRPDGTHPTSGLAAAAGMRAAEEMIAAEDVLRMELPLLLGIPTDEEVAAGVVVHFEITGQRVKGTVSRGDAGLAVTSVTVEGELPGGVTQRFLRDVPLASVLRAVRAYLSLMEAQRRGTSAFLPATGLSAPTDAELIDTSGRVEVTDELLRQVALVFIDESAPGKDSNAVQRVAQRYGRPVGTVRTWIARARKDGWLEPGSKGRIGAEPGPRLLEWAAAQLVNPDAVVAEAHAIAARLGVEVPGIAKAAVRAFQDIDEREIARRIGLPPLEASVAAQVLYGQTLSAELADRERREDHLDAQKRLVNLATELRRALAHHQDDDGALDKES